MKTLIAALMIALTASSAMAEAPCESPPTLPCQKACAAMGAKFVMSMRQDRQNAINVVKSSATYSAGMVERARHLAGFAGVSLQDIDRMTLHDLAGAVGEYCTERR